MSTPRMNGGHQHQHQIERHKHMTTTNAPTTAAKKTQNVIAVSGDFKGFVKEQTEIFSAPSKSREVMAATEKEITNAMLAFVEANRIQVESRPVMETVIGEDGTETEVQTYDADGNPVFEDVEIDGFALEVQRELALRGSITRTSSKDAKIAELEAQLAALLAAKGELAAS